MYAARTALYFLPMLVKNLCEERQYWFDMGTAFVPMCLMRVKVRGRSWLMSEWVLPGNLYNSYIMVSLQIVENI